jgi:hypothetical protein
MARYVWDKATFQFVDRTTRKPMDLPYRGQICAPTVISDIPEYLSPIDGRPITSRSERREDMKRNDCVEIDPPKRPRHFKNKRFTKRHSLPYL